MDARGGCIVRGIIKVESQRINIGFGRAAVLFHCPIMISLSGEKFGTRGYILDVKCTWRVNMVELKMAYQEGTKKEDAVLSLGTTALS